MAHARDDEHLPPILTDAKWVQTFELYAADVEAPLAITEGAAFSLVLAPKGRRQPDAALVYTLTGGAFSVGANVITVTAHAAVTEAWEPGEYVLELRDVTSASDPDPIYVGQIWIARGLSQLAELGGGAAWPGAAAPGVQIVREAVRVVRGEAAGSAEAAAGSAAAAADSARDAADLVAGSALRYDVAQTLSGPQKAQARANAGLVIGTDVQAYDADLAAFAGVTSAADKLFYFTGAAAGAVTTLSAFGRSLIDDVDATTARATLGLVIGSNVQAYDAELGALASLTSAADTLPYFTGPASADITTLSAYGRTLIDDANAGAARVTLGLALGVDVQAYNGNLAAIAGVASASNKLFYFTGSGAGALADLSTFGRSLIEGADATAARATLVLDQVQNKSSATIRGELTSSNVTAALGFTPINAATRGAANGVASLGADGKLPSTQLPAIAITDTFVVASQAAMLALVVERGDVAVRSDVNESYILAADDPTILANWTKLRTPTDVVLSVVGLTGAISAASLKSALSIDLVENKSSSTIRGELTASNVTTALTYTPTSVTGLTGAQTPAAVRTGLGLVIGTTVQAFDADLDAIAGAGSSADKLAYYTGVASVALTTFTAFGRSLVDDADAAGARTTLGLGTVATLNTGIAAGEVPLLGLAGALALNGALSAKSIDAVGYVSAQGATASLIACTRTGAGANAILYNATGVNLAVNFGSGDVLGISATGILTTTGSVTAGGSCTAAAGSYHGWVGRGGFKSIADGQFSIRNALDNAYGTLIALGYTATGNVTAVDCILSGNLKFGGTASEAMLKRVGAGVQVRKADDSGFATLSAYQLVLDAYGSLQPQGDGVWILQSSTPSPFLHLKFGANSATTPGLRNVNNRIRISSTDQTAWLGLEAQEVRLGGGQGYIGTLADGIFQLLNDAKTDALGLTFGPATSSFPRLSRDGTGFSCGLGDSSNFTSMKASYFSVALFGRFAAAGDGQFFLTKNDGTGAVSLAFGVAGTTHPMLKKVGTTVAVRLSNDSDDAPLTALTIKTKALTVATLPAAATAGAGARAFVTDATTTTFLSSVVGGGSNSVPVVTDGTNWLIG